MSPVGPELTSPDLRHRSAIGEQAAMTGSWPLISGTKPSREPILATEGGNDPSGGG
jgi:hypothetical protein